MSMKAFPSATHWAPSSWERPWGKAAKTTSDFATTSSWVPHTRSITWR